MSLRNDPCPYSKTSVLSRNPAVKDVVTKVLGFAPHYSAAVPHVRARLARLAGALKPTRMKACLERTTERLAASPRPSILGRGGA